MFLLFGYFDDRNSLVGGDDAHEVESGGLVAQADFHRIDGGIATIDHLSESVEDFKAAAVLVGADGDVVGRGVRIGREADELKVVDADRIFGSCRGVGDNGDDVGVGAREYLIGGVSSGYIDGVLLPSGALFCRGNCRCGWYLWRI